MAPHVDYKIRSYEKIAKSLDFSGFLDSRSISGSVPQAILVILINDSSDSNHSLKFTVLVVVV